MATEFEFNKQYGAVVPGRSEQGNIDLDNRVPYYPNGLGNVALPHGFGDRGVVKTEESTTIPTDKSGKPIFERVPDDHPNWVNIPTVLHGTQREGKEYQDAVMNYMLTGKHLGQFSEGVGLAVDDARRTHIRQMNAGKQVGLGEVIQNGLDFAVGN